MEQNFSLLNRLIPHLILNYHFVLNAGLLNGKMGGVVFFGQMPDIQVSLIFVRMPKNC